MQDCDQYTLSAAKERTNEDAEPKTKSAPPAGWAVLNLLPYCVNPYLFLDPLAYFIFCDI